METLAAERTLTELDHVRLSNLVRRDAADGARPVPDGAIAAVLDAASIVPSRRVGADVVTMYSQVLLQDVATGERLRLTLCYPSDAEPAAGFVSALSPVGVALIGLTVGSDACWTTPLGDQRSARVLAILFQPEASGDYSI